MTTSLITGVSGQDGGYLAQLLSARGHVVHGVVKPGDGPVHLIESVPGLVLHEGDLADPTLFERLVSAVQPDEIYHLAGISSVAFSWEHPVMTAELTAMPVIRLLDAVRSSASDYARVVLAASAEIFGVPAHTPQTEETPVRPVSPYGAAKAFAHHLAEVYRRQGLHVSSLVLYNHESPRRPRSFVTRKITSTVAAISLGMAEELVLGNLDARRDWGWAPDFVEAMSRAASAAVPDDYVIATGMDHSVRDFVEAAFAAAGIEDWTRYLKQDADLARPADAPLLVGDSSKARDRLEWVPTTQFDEIVTRMVEHDLQALTP